MLSIMDKTKLFFVENFYFDMAPLSIKAILVALFCGFIVGLERQWSGKPAGIRTSILICAGAYTYIAMAVYKGAPDDYNRIIGQLVTGIGFLGAGVMLSKEGVVIGVTSASVIWMLAAIGALIGFGKYGPAILMSGLTIFVLVGINMLEKAFVRLKTGVHRDTEPENAEKKDNLGG